MCGLCGFGQSDAELLLSADLSHRDGRPLVNETVPRRADHTANDVDRQSAKLQWQASGVTRTAVEFWDNYFRAPRVLRGLKRWQGIRFTLPLF